MQAEATLNWPDHSCMQREIKKEKDEFEDWATFSIDCFDLRTHQLLQLLCMHAPQLPSLKSKLVLPLPLQSGFTFLLHLYIYQNIYVWSIHRIRNQALDYLYVFLLYSYILCADPLQYTRKQQATDSTQCLLCTYVRTLVAGREGKRKTTQLAWLDVDNRSFLQLRAS